VRYINEALHRLQSLPGIESAAFVAPLPFTGANVGSDFRIEGDPEPEPGHAPGAYNRTVTPNYFEALKIPLKRGRYFSDQDRRGEVGAAIVNETFVRTILPNRDPLGVRLTQIGAQNKGDPEKWEIVGVVGDVHHLSLSQSAAPELYLPYQQNSWNWGHIIVRTSQRPALMTRIFTDTLQGIDPGVLIWGVTPLEAAIDGTTAQPRFYTLLFSLFGATGLFLTLTGIYSVISFTVSQRMREVGIRIALGAESLDVLRLICGRGMFLAIAGTTIGAIFAAVLTRGMANLLFELQPGDLPTFVIVALILLTAALPACWLPARRATKADPTLALRDEL
jgi:putative ABC transport system permease protein